MDACALAALGRAAGSRPLHGAQRSHYVAESVASLNPRDTSDVCANRSTPTSMPRRIYLIDDQNALTELREQPYDSEALLQQLLADHPAVLAGNSGGSADVQWLLVTREAPVPAELVGGDHMFVDHLFLDQTAVPTLVEVKRSSDTRIRREVVGQLLDYAANAVAYWPVERLQALFIARCEKQGINAEDALAQFLGGALDEASFWGRVKTNLQAGRLRLVFVADVIPAQLQRVVEFLNQQMDPAEVLALEVRQFVSNGVRTLVPTLVGQTAAAQHRKGVETVGKQWDEASFFEDLSKRAPTAQSVAEHLLLWTKQRSLQLWWGNGKTMGSFVPVLRHAGVEFPLFAVWSSGTIEFYFQWLAPKPAFADGVRLHQLLAQLNAIAGVAIPESSLRKRPNVPLQTFAPQDARSQLTSVLDRLVDDIRALPPASSLPPDDEQHQAGA